MPPLIRSRLRHGMTLRVGDRVDAFHIEPAQRFVVRFGLTAVIGRDNLDAEAGSEILSGHLRRDHRALAVGQSRRSGDVDVGQDGYVTFDQTNAVFGLTPQVRTLSEGPLAETPADAKSPHSGAINADMVMKASVGAPRLEPGTRGLKATCSPGHDGSHAQRRSSNPRARHISRPASGRKRR
jgi:hypothetical protein